jgi:hypothetical protein
MNINVRSVLVGVGNVLALAAVERSVAFPTRYYARSFFCFVFVVPGMKIVESAWAQIAHRTVYLVAMVGPRSA